MTRVTASKLKDDVDEILQRVRDGEQFEVLRDGEAVARIVPVAMMESKTRQSIVQPDPPMEPRPLSPDDRARVDAIRAKGEELRRRTSAERAAGLARLDTLAKRIDENIPEDVRVIDGLEDLRRDL